jgi:two-component system response regulator FixJ
MNGANQTSCSVHPPNAGEDERRLSNSLVHLVDDDDAVRTTLARLLVLSGYEVREYASGAELLDAADGLEGGCILLDLNMPETGGLAVRQALKDRSIDIPVIIMTGAGDSVPPLDGGVASVIRKPFRRAELVSLLDRIFAESHPTAKAP